VAERRGSVIEFIKLGFREALFTMRDRGWIFLLLVAMVLVYPLIGTANYLNSEELKSIPTEARQQIFIQSMVPVMVILSFLAAVITGTVISSLISEEKTSGILEYFTAYTPYSGSKVLIVKLLSAVLVGAIICIIYVAGYTIGIAVIAGVWMDLRIPLIIFATSLFTVVPISLLLTLSAFALEQKYNAIIGSAAPILIMMLITQISKGLSENPKDVISMLSNTVTPIYIVLALLLAVAVAIYIALKDRIVELSLR